MPLFLLTYPVRVSLQTCLQLGHYLPCTLLKVLLACEGDLQQGYSWGIPKSYIYSHRKEVLNFLLLQSNEKREFITLFCFRQVYCSNNRKTSAAFLQILCYYVELIWYCLNNSDKHLRPKHMPNMQ